MEDIIREEATKHFVAMGRSISKEEMFNIICTIKDFLEKKELFIRIIVRALYPVTEFEYNEKDITSF